jgi:predicted AAA+ superfamily ATPase
VQLVQVCWSLREELTAEREVQSLKAAMRALKVDKGLIVTWMEEANPCKSITAVPFWKWAAERV